MKNEKNEKFSEKITDVEAPKKKMPIWFLIIIVVVVTLLLCGVGFYFLNQMMVDKVTKTTNDQVELLNQQLTEKTTQLATLKTNLAKAEEILKGLQENKLNFWFYWDKVSTDSLVWERMFEEDEANRPVELKSLKEVINIQIDSCNLAENVSVINPACLADAYLVTAEDWDNTKDHTFYILLKDETQRYYGPFKDNVQRLISDVKDFEFVKFK